MNQTYKHKINFIIQVKDANFTLITRLARKPQKFLLCGWRRDIDDMIVVRLSIEALICFSLQMNAADFGRKSTQGRTNSQDF